MTPRISVLLPTRNRPRYLHRSIASLHALAADHGNIELLLAIDDDDPVQNPDIPFVFGDFQILRGPRNGYSRLHLNWNELAAAATGDFLMIWNDDAEMLTPCWDRLLCAGREFSIQFMRRNTLQHADMTFPVISSAVHRAMGHLSKIPQADLWLDSIGSACSIKYLRDDVVLNHHREDGSIYSENVLTPYTDDDAAQHAIWRATDVQAVSLEKERQR